MSLGYTCAWQQNSIDAGASKACAAKLANGSSSMMVAFGFGKLKKVVWHRASV
jgi:hypothetical protein